MLIFKKKYIRIPMFWKLLCTTKVILKRKYTTTIIKIVNFKAYE